MVTPLKNIREADGQTYERPPEIEQALEALAQRPRDEVLGLIAIRSRKNPDYVPSECLVHLIRATHADNNHRYFDTLYSELLRRIARALPRADERSVDGKEGTNAQREQVRDDVRDRFVLLLADDLATPGGHLDIYECRFDYTVARDRDRAWRHLGTETSKRHVKTVEEVTESIEAGGVSDAATVIEVLRESSAQPLEWRARTFSNLSPEGGVALGAIAEALKGFSSDAQPWAILARILLDRTRLGADLVSDGSVAARAKGAAIWQFMNFIRVQPRGAGLPIRRLLDRIRNLVRLADDRELRQLPEAAQSIDAVRLMTIHGSKGLQFDVVHVLGLNQQSLPWTGGPRPKCPPPDDLIVGAETSGEEFVAGAEAEEQECLFYVSLSRARDHLTIHSVRRRAGGASRPESSYLARINGLTKQDLDLAAQVLPDEDAEPLPVSLIAPLTVSLAQLEAYRRCPRRFLYTYVLQVGGRRTATSFMDMHNVVQAAVVELCAPDGRDDADLVFDGMWGTAPIAETGFADDYRQMGRGLIEAFMKSRASRAAAPVFDMPHTSTAGTVHVRPDEVLTESTGGRVVRRVRTGKRPSADYRVGEEAFALAARGAGVAAELVYLADGHEPVPLVFKEATLAKKAEQIAQTLAELSSGFFPMKESERSCPSCPAFFVCGPVPPGSLEKKLEGQFPASPS